MKLCVDIPDVKILVMWQGANIKPLLDLAEILLPHVPCKAEYVHTILHSIQMDYLAIEVPWDITQHTLTGVGPNHLAFAEACRHFYYVEHSFPELVDKLVDGLELAGSQLIVQRSKFLIVDQR